MGERAHLARSVNRGTENPMGILPCTRPRLAEKIRACVAGTLAAALVALAATGCAQTATTDGTAAIDQLEPTTLAIIHTGGIKGSFAQDDSSMGIGMVPALASELRQQGHEVLVMDSGNTLGGEAIVDLTDGEDAVGFMNAAGYDCMALGYQELALGSERLYRRISQSDFAYLSANITAPTAKKQTHQAHHKFVLADGRLVGVFGLTAPQVTDNLPPLSASQFSSSEDSLAASAQKEISALHNEGCSLVVCLASLGYDDSGELRAEQLCSQVSGIDVVLDASAEESSHKTIQDASENDTLLVETAGGLQGATVVTWMGDALDARTVDASSLPAPNEQCNALVTQAKMVLDEHCAERLTSCPEEIDANASQASSCGLGALTAKAILWDVSRGKATKPDAALIDATLLRKGLPKGDVTFADTLAALPHPTSKLCAMQLTGEKLQKALAPLLAEKPEATATMPQIAGITIEEKKQDGKTVKAITRVGDKDFSPSESYTIATCESLLAYPRSLSEFVDEKQELTDLNSSADKALADYLRQECKDGIPKDYLTK